MNNKLIFAVCRIAFVITACSPATPTSAALPAGWEAYYLPNNQPIQRLDWLATT